MKTNRSFCGKMALALVATVFGAGTSVLAQGERALGVDISYWNCGTGGGISQANWNTGFTTGNRKFAWIRATRGGTTGVDQPQGTPGGGSTATLSRRYDDSRFIQNISRAAASGMLAGPYHFGRPDNAGNTGTDEADHFIQMAGLWMRPGYLMPVFDLEAGSGVGGVGLAQFSIDFSDRIYAVMKIRPGMYINGNYSGIVQGATLAQRDRLAKPAVYTPSVIGPAYPMLWDARYSDNDPATWMNIPVQTGSPKTTYTTINSYYGPWDDYGDTTPWSFWQYASVASVPGFNAVDTGIDVNVSQGDIEYVRNYLVPAVWWNDSNGDWSTLANWNSGQPVVAPVPGAGQAAPYATGPLPIARLPGAAGSIPDSGQFDTVILERPNANITVTVSSGSHNVRKFYMREALNISSGALTINYNPAYRADNLANVLHGGPVSAQFSGPVTLSGTGSLNVHTLQVDTSRTFTLSGGNLTFNTINLMPHSTTPAKIVMSGNVNLNPLANATATIQKGTGSGASGLLDLGGGNRTITVGNGSAAVDFSLDIPVINGGLTKAGSGTMRLTSVSSYAGGTTLSAGTLLVNNATGSGTGSGAVTVNGGTLGGTGTIAGALTLNSGGTLSPGLSIGTLTLNSAATLNGTTLMEINRNGGASLADKIVVTSGAVNYGGTLVVSNVGATFIGGEVFTNFTASSYTGAFANTVLPTLNSGLNWYLGHLTTNGTIKVNRRPTANMVTLTNGFSGVLQIPIATLINGTDLDGDTLSFSNFATTTNGITLSNDSTFLIYSNNVNVADRFAFTLTDNRGGFATNVVNIVPSPVVIGEFAQQPIANGNSVTLHFSGTPGVTYYVDRSTNLPPAWLTIWTNIAPESGLFDYTDDFGNLSESPASSFYRLRW